MTHILFYIGLSAMLLFAVFFIFLITLRKDQPQNVKYLK